MELRHVYGNTYAAVGATALMPVYKLTERDIVLMDTGYARLDRSALVNLIEGNGFRLRGILCSHAHFDHTGNVRYLQQRYGCQAAAQIIEAGISVNTEAYRANYVALTYGKSREYLLEECFPADVIIPADAEHLDFCGARFGILQLPGHSAGHIGVVTPDGVAYLGDCLIDEEQIAAAKLPTSMFIARDLESKESLRNLRRPAYIIAHKQVLTDIGPLIDRNIAFIHDKGRELMEDLEDGMSFDQWIYAFCQRENVRTRNEFKFSIVERNFANFVDWLTDEGKVEVRREFCAKHYFHREK
ncbi:MBL fold metallo-hydrolase [Clostridiaceae bacterium Marseille-Q4149]|nr:MBL fold metallo-hydrolase [Clostridiaceae bacterium Marseille-Q4149]